MVKWACTCTWDVGTYCIGNQRRLRPASVFVQSRQNLRCPHKHRGSYMSTHVLLILLNELGKRDKMRGLPSIVSLFCDEFNKFNKTGARMLDDIKITLTSHFWRKKRNNVVNMYATLLWTSLRFPKIDKPLVVYRFYCMTLFHSQTRCHMIKSINVDKGLVQSQRVP